MSTRRAHAFVSSSVAEHVRCARAVSAYTSVRPTPCSTTRPLRECPSNDGHNVDTIDGLVLPTAVALATLGQPAVEAEAAVAACVGVTRRSPALESHAKVWTSLLRAVTSGEPLKKATLAACEGSRSPALQQAAREISMGRFDAVVS